MAKNDVALRKSDTILDDLNQLHRAISRRAYDYFRDRGTLWGNPLGDWLNAERELVWKPAVELREKGDQFEVLVATPGVEAKDLNVQITPDDLLIKAAVEHEHTSQEGAVQVCEFTSGNLFRSIHFPKAINPDSVKAEYRDGMLRLTVAIAKATTTTKVEVKAA